MTVASLPTQKFFKNKNTTHWLRWVVSRRSLCENKYENHWCLGVETWNYVQYVHCMMNFNWPNNVFTSFLFLSAFFFFSFLFFGYWPQSHMYSIQTPNSICVYTQFVNGVNCFVMAVANHLIISVSTVTNVNVLTEWLNWLNGRLFLWALQQKIVLNVLKRLD